MMGIALFFRSAHFILKFSLALFGKRDSGGGVMKVAAGEREEEEEERDEILWNAHLDTL